MTTTPPGQWNSSPSTASRATTPRWCALFAGRRGAPTRPFGRRFHYIHTPVTRISVIQRSTPSSRRAGSPGCSGGLVDRDAQFDGLAAITPYPFQP